MWEDGCCCSTLDWTVFCCNIVIVVLSGWGASGSICAKQQQQQLQQKARQETSLVPIPWQHLAYREKTLLLPCTQTKLIRCPSSRRGKMRILSGKKNCRLPVLLPKNPRWPAHRHSGNRIHTHSWIPSKYGLLPIHRGMRMNTTSAFW